MPSPRAEVIVVPLDSSKNNSFKLISVMYMILTGTLKAPTVIWLYQKKRIAKNSASMVIVKPLLGRD